MPRTHTHTQRHTHEHGDTCHLANIRNSSQINVQDKKEILNEIETWYAPCNRHPNVGLFVVVVVINNFLFHGNAHSARQLDTAVNISKSYKSKKMAERK